MENNTIKIGKNAKVRVLWNDIVENYSRESKSAVRSYFAKKYGIDRYNIDVRFVPVKVTEDGTVIDMTGIGIDNILDINYQRILFKQWIEKEGKVVDFNRLLALDDKVNAALNVGEVDTRQRKYNLKWIKIDNFLCFGDLPAVHFSRLKGMNAITSIPANQGGKSSFSVDSIEFLLFGKTTKTDKYEEIFNGFSDKDIVNVRGCIELDGGEEYIIERILTRKAKKEGGYNVKGDVIYYEILPNGEEKQLEGDSCTQTSQRIKDTIGTLEDFELIILATDKNLEDLIDTKPTERGKLLTRFIGLEPIEKKEDACRKLYNEFTKKMTSNTYNISDLQSGIDEQNIKVEQTNSLLIVMDNSLIKLKSDIATLGDKRDEVLGKKYKIDDEIMKINVDELNTDIDKLTAKGVIAKDKVAEAEKRLLEIGEVEFDEDYNQSLVDEDKNLSIAKTKNESQKEKLEALIVSLKNSEICTLCKRPLEGIDHTKDIKKTQDDIKTIDDTITSQEIRLKEIAAELLLLDVNKKLTNEKQLLEVSRDRLQVEMDTLRNKIKTHKNSIKQFNLNNEAIEINKTLDVEINNYNTQINVLNVKKDNLLKDIQKYTTELEVSKKTITTNEGLILKIQKEDMIEKIYKIYIEMVGKRGISKLVLRTVIPIINAELQRLLDDICDFDVELEITDKNDVEFILNKDGVSKSLKTGSGFERTASAIALRAVLGRISYLPKPNFLEFDEVWGKVADENLENMKALFERLMDWHDVIIMITHNAVVRDWATNIITFRKVNNISNIS